MTSGGEGHGLLELIVVLGLVVLMVAGAAPQFMAWADEYRLRGATLYLKGLIRSVRSQAAAQRRYVGIVFDEQEGEIEFSIYADGNNNGIRRTEVRSGIDLELRRPWRLSSVFPGVTYGSPPQGSQPLPGLKIGRSRILSFSPLGSSTSGTIYLSNRFGLVYAVIVYGPTGRVRMARYLDGKWVALS